MNSLEKAGTLLNALKEKEFVESKLSETNSKIAQLTVELNELMLDEDCDSVELQGIKFSPIAEQNYALDEEEIGKKWDDCVVFFEWLDSIGEGGAKKTKVTVPWNTRLRILKEFVEKGGILPVFIRETFFNTVKWNKSAIKRLVQADKEAVA